MPVPYIDRVTNLTLTERHGVIRSLTRLARVVFTDPSPPNDFTVLSQALTVVPAAFSNLAQEGYASLTLIERTPSLAENDPRTVDVVLKYEHIMDGPNQKILTPPQPLIIFGKGRCSIVEKTTNFYRPFGNPNADRVQILVAHTFDQSDMRVITFDPDLPRTVVQGGEVSIPFPQANYHIQGVLTVVDPWYIAQAFVATINKVTWLGYPPFTWICSEVQFEVQDVTTFQYKFDFEFQYNIDTWNPTVVFLDQQTGRPPAKVVKAFINDDNGVLSLATNPLADPNVILDGGGNVIGTAPKKQPAGMWEVPALLPRNFDELFGSFFEGSPGALGQ